MFWQGAAINGSASEASNGRIGLVANDNLSVRAVDIDRHRIKGGPLCGL
jgi:hypothetical protein